MSHSILLLEIWVQSSLQRDAAAQGKAASAKHCLDADYKDALYKLPFKAHA